MKKWMFFALVVVVAVALVAYYTLNDMSNRAEENVRKIELLYAGDGVALASEVYRLSTSLSGERPDEKYELAKSLQGELAAWEAEYQNALSENGIFAFIERGASLNNLADRRVELSSRIEALLAGE